MTIIFRKDKQYPLTYPEMDENFRDLLEDTDLQRITENGNTANLGISVNTFKTDTLVRKKADWYTDDWTTGLLTSNSGVITIGTGDSLFGNSSGQIRANGTIIQSNSNTIFSFYDFPASPSVPTLIEPLTLTITPKNKNNKILCELDLNYSCKYSNYVGATNDETEVFIERNGEFIANTRIDASSHYPVTTPKNYKLRKFRLSYIDDAKDTQPITYKIYVKVKNIGISQGTKYENHGGIKEISGTANCIAMIRENGVVQTWGHNSYGVLGLGDTNYRSYPTQVFSGGTPFLAKKISAARNSMIAIDVNDNLWQWGQIGNSTFYISASSTPVLLSSSGDWDKIFNVKDEGLTAFAQTKFAIKKNGTLWTWGFNSFGKSGLNAPTAIALYPTGGYIPSPIQIGSRTDWKKISSNLYTVVGIAGDTLFGWGYNYSGQLANSFPPEQRRSSPVLVLSNVLDVDINYTITTLIRQATRTDDFGFSVSLRQPFFMGDNTNYNITGITDSVAITPQIKVSSPINIGSWWWNVDYGAYGRENPKFYEDFETCHAGLFNAYWISQSNTVTGNVYNTVYPTGKNTNGWCGMENGENDILFYSNNILYPNRHNLSGTVPNHTTSNQKFQCAIGGSGESYYLKDNDVYSWGFIPVHIWGATWKEVDPQIVNEFPVNPPSSTDNFVNRSRPTLVMSVNLDSTIPDTGGQFPSSYILYEMPRIIRINGSFSFNSSMPNYQNVVSSFIVSEISS